MTMVRRKIEKARLGLLVGSGALPTELSRIVLRNPLWPFT